MEKNLKSRIILGFIVLSLFLLLLSFAHADCAEDKTACYEECDKACSQKKYDYCRTYEYSGCALDVFCDCNKCELLDSKWCPEEGFNECATGPIGKYETCIKTCQTNREAGADVSTCWKDCNDELNEGILPCKNEQCKTSCTSQGYEDGKWAPYTQKGGYDTCACEGKKTTTTTIITPIALEDEPDVDPSLFPDEATGGNGGKEPDQPQMDIPDANSSKAPDFSSPLLQGIVAAGGGLGLVELLRRLLGKTPGALVDTSALDLLKEEMKELPDYPEQPETGVSESEDVLDLPDYDKTEEKLQRKYIRDNFGPEAVKNRRKLNWKLDSYFRGVADEKGWTPKEEYNALWKAIPKFDDFKNKLEYNSADWKHKQWQKSWNRRNPSKKIGKMSEGKASQFMATAGSRA